MSMIYNFLVHFCSVLNKQFLSSNQYLSVEKFNFKIITDPADLMKFVQHLKESNRKVST